jgi:hypothetical protein
MTTLEEALALSRSNGRVCPQPQKWNSLYELLPNRVRVGGGWHPALPLILSAWWDTPDPSKAARLQEHLEWAAKHNSLESVYLFLASLTESEWHHVGE